jgi:outer membrane protein assembly factor BamB
MSCGGGDRVDDGTPSRPSTSSVTTQITAAHDGVAAIGAVSLPSSPTWQVRVDGRSSYPLIGDGRVFVLHSPNSGGGALLRALSTATGALLWEAATIPGTYPFGAHALDAERVVVVNSDGLLQAFDVATGSRTWTLALPDQNSFRSAPTIAGGLAYVTGSGTGSTLYAVRLADGVLAWRRPVDGGGSSSPTIGDDRIYVGGSCGIDAFDQTDGNSRWAVDLGCIGGGDDTVVYAGGSLYLAGTNGARPMISSRRASDGALVASLPVAGSRVPTVPAVDADALYLNADGTLRRLDRALATAQWSFTGDGLLASAPVVADRYVFIGSVGGSVFALDKVTGALAWTGLTPEPIFAPEDSSPPSGLAVGEGLLVVPSGSTLTAWRLAPS